MRSPLSHVEPTNKFDLADRLVVAELVQTDLFHRLGAKSRKALCGTRLVSHRSVAEFGELVRAIESVLLFKFLQVVVIELRPEIIRTRTIIRDKRFWKHELC